MKILILSQRYWPESFRITDIAEELVKRGNDVTVLTGLPNYPKGYIFDDYKNGKNRIQEHNGVKIVRAKEIERRNDLVHRFLNYYSFPHYAKKIIKKMDNDFDVVLINELSPIMAAIPAFLYKKKHNVKVVMYEMDLWPESLLAGGIKKNSILYKHYWKTSGKIYSQCDKILVSTKEHIEYIKKLPKCSGLDIEYLPQYAESIFENIKPKQFDEKHIEILFAGNIGKAQSIETIIKAANELKDDKRFMFHIVGGGSELENSELLTKDLKLNNVKFYGPKPVTEMPHYYEMCDAALVSLENKGYANMTIPGKVQTYMCAGKPIIGAINGATQNLIKENEIGVCCNSEDFVELGNIIRCLNEQSVTIFKMNAKKMYAEEFNKDKFFEKLIIELMK